MLEKFENISIDDIWLGLIIRSGYKDEGIKFFTPNSSSQQLAYMNRPQGYKIQPHYHNVVKREVEVTQEVLFIRSGKVRVDFYTNKKEYIDSRILYSGDVILFATGGHGFEMMENSEIIEVKQGPYVGDEDKTRFQAVSDQNVQIKNQ